MSKVFSLAIGLRGYAYALAIAAGTYWQYAALMSDIQARYDAGSRNSGAILIALPYLLVLFAFYSIVAVSVFAIPIESAMWIADRRQKRRSSE
jgi:hypothetical protein